MASAVEGLPERESAPQGAALYGMRLNGPYYQYLVINKKNEISFGTPNFPDFIVQDVKPRIDYIRLAEYIQATIPSCVVINGKLCDNNWIDFIGSRINPIAFEPLSGTPIPEDPTLHGLYIRLGLRRPDSGWDPMDLVNYIPENLSMALAAFIVGLLDATGHNSRRYTKVSRTIQFVDGPKTIPVKVYTSEEMDLIRNIICAIFNRVDLIPTSELFVDEDGAGAGAGAGDA